MGAGYGGGGVPGGVIRGNSLTSTSLCLMCLGGDRSFIDSDAIKRLLASDGDIAVVPNCSGLDFVRWCLVSAFEALKLASWEN
ncbi:alkyl hydroperoxide reductase subunit f [Lasius niger]|uniref:Alkyl hydroperoxide reductase subunit f n=1 Tax=Lasius niger TaxID=67767 RepID=A0A0J7L575_LASNI|nr:alkyl hydroperoxide reductase subunit f [Lasius niger]